MYHKNPVIPIIIVPLFMASAVCAFGVTHLFQWLPLPRLARQFALCMVCHIVNYHSRGRADADYVELSRPGDRHFTHRAPRCCTAPQQDRVQVHRQAHRSYHAVLHRDPAASYHYVCLGPLRISPLILYRQGAQAHMTGPGYSCW